MAIGSPSRSLRCIVFVYTSCGLRSDAAPFPSWSRPLAEIAIKFTRITVDPNQLGGVPCVRSLRVPAATVVGMIADGMTEAEILTAYPDLKADDIHEALRFAADAVRERGLPLSVP